MRKYFSYVFFIISTLIIMMNNVNAAAVFGNVSSYGNGSYETCGSKYNGCIGIYSYRYTIVHGINIVNSGVTYNKVSGTSSYEVIESDFPKFQEPSTKINNIKKGGTLFKNIIENTGVSMKDFFSKKYYILVEVRLAVFYSDSGSKNNWANDKVMIGYPNEIASNLKNGSPYPFSHLTGLRSVTKQIPCYLYLPSSGSPDDTYCTIGANDAYRQHYLNMATNNTRYGKGLVYAGDISAPNGSIKITKTNSVTGGKISGVGFTLYSNSSCTTVKVSQKNTNSSGEVKFNDLSPGTYYYKETNPPADYVADTSCKSVNVYAGSITSKSVTNEPYGKIKIKKVNDAGNLIMSGSVKINIYSGKGCSKYKEQKSFTGTTTLNYQSGWYSVKEIEAPPYYDVDKECHDFFIDTKNDNVEVQIKNRSTCVIDVLELIEVGTVNDRIERIKIYKKHGGADKHRNLLDFTDPYVSGEDAEEYATNTCSSPEKQKTYLSSWCLNVSYRANFNENKWTHYTETIDLDSNTGYCNTLLSFEKAASIPWNRTTISSQSYYSLSNEEVKAGTFVFKSDVLGTATVTKKCWFANEVSGDLEDSYYNYVYLLNFNGVPITPSINNDGEFNLTKQSYADGIGTYYEGSITATYNLSDVKIKKISGEFCTDDAYDCVSIGSGILSEFRDGKNIDGKLYVMDEEKKYVVVPFSIDVNTNVFNKNINVGNGSRACIYPVAPEIIKYDTNTRGNLELEFRSIDPDNPFERNTKSNWCAEKDNCEKNNQTVIDTITNSNNSYNRTGQGSLYTNQTGSKKIVLTPDLVQEIREYNANVGSYEKSEYELNESGVWENVFFRDIAKIKKS